MASHRRPKQPSRARVTVLTTAAAAAVVLSSQAANAAPSEKLTKDEVKTKVDKLYEDAEQATEKYNGAKEKQEKLQKEISTIQDNVARGQADLNELRDSMGLAAAAQYRTGSIDPSLQLLLSSDPDDYLDKASAADQLSAQQVEALKKIQEKQRELAQERSEASTKLKDLATTRTELGKKKKEVQAKLTEARKLLNTLTAKEQASLAAADDRASRDMRRPGGPRRLPDGLRPGHGRLPGRPEPARQAVPVRRHRHRHVRLLGSDLLGLRPGGRLHPAHLAGAGQRWYAHLLAERPQGRRPGHLLRRPAPRRLLRGQRPGAARPAHRHRRALRVDQQHALPVRRPDLIGPRTGTPCRPNGRITATRSDPTPRR